MSKKDDKTNSSNDSNAPEGSDVNNDGSESSDSKSTGNRVTRPHPVARGRRGSNNRGNSDSNNAPSTPGVSSPREISRPRPVCSICERSFSKMANLRAHERVSA